MAGAGRLKRSPPASIAVSVVVVAHNSGQVLGDCIGRVLAQDVELEVIVVDNASHDRSLDLLPKDPRLRCIRNPHNPGFSIACNQGAREASSASLLFLNPDCLLPPAAVRRLLERLAMHPSIGLLGAQLVEADGRQQSAARRSLPTLRGLFRTRTAQPARAPIGEIEWVEATSGALMLLPRPVFDAVGGFDEGYRLHCEDLDLCRRVQIAGWRVAIDPDLQVTHLKGTSSQRRPIWVEWQKHRGMLRYLRRFECRGPALLLYPLLWAAVWLRFVPAAARAWWSARRARRRLRQ